MGKKQWQQYRGKSRVCCRGRCLMANDASVLGMTLALIVVCSCLFFAFDCRLLAVSVSPAIPVAAVLQFAFVMCCLLRTSCMDPGVLPRAGREEAEWMEAQAEPAKVAEGAYRPQARMKDVVIGGRVFKLKFCVTCKLWRPPRASHCSSCDNCVDRFDHHCPWVGNCVGRRNYRYFYMFLASLSVYCLFIMCCSALNIGIIAKSKETFLDALQESPPSVVVMLVAFFSVWSVAGLAGFHTLLACREQSTNEDIKGVYKWSLRHQQQQQLSRHNPFSRGSGLSNCCYVLCGPQQPSLLLLAEDDDDDEEEPEQQATAEGGGSAGCKQALISEPHGSAKSATASSASPSSAASAGGAVGGGGGGGGSPTKYGSTHAADPKPDPPPADAAAD